MRGPSKLLSRSDSLVNFALLSTFKASVRGSRERGKLEKRNTSCKGTIDAFSGEGISRPRSRQRRVGETRGTVCARCFEDAPGCPGLVQERSRSVLIAEKSNGPLGCFVSVVARRDRSEYQSLVSRRLGFQFKAPTIIMDLLQSFTLSFISLWRKSWLLGQGLPLWGSRLGRREQQFVITLIPTNSDVRRSMNLRGASGKIRL